MMQENEKTTVPIPSVGADGEQSLSYVTNEIITTGNEEINPIDESMEEMLRQMQRMSDPSYLATMTMSQLYDTVYESRLPVIDGLLYPGTYLFVGAPKVGKSFLMAQIAYHVSTGQALWNYSNYAGTVLYLALRMITDACRNVCSVCSEVDGTDTLHFATCAKQLGAGLYEQLARFVSEHRDTRLIIIDTLQKIREASADKFSYASDYEILVSEVFCRSDGHSPPAGASYPKNSRQMISLTAFPEQTACLVLLTERLFWKRKNAPEILRYWKCPAEISRNKD